MMRSLGFFVLVFFYTVTTGWSEWGTLDGCQWIERPHNDGDSFYVSHEGKTYIFRLYGVDAPEVDLSFPDRVDEQAQHFGSSRSEMIRIAREATRFTKRLLSRPFRVETEWMDARGNSPIPRYYAVVTTAEGKDLSEELAAAGLVRVYGFQPPAALARSYSKSRLLRLEQRARLNGDGAWAYAKRRNPSTSVPGSMLLARSTAEVNDEGLLNQESVPLVTKDGSRAASPSSAGGVNINVATIEELQTLPGIGPHLADLIVARRPYTSTEELLEIRGIGPKTLDRIRELVTVE